MIFCNFVIDFCCIHERPVFTVVSWSVIRIWFVKLWFQKGTMPCRLLSGVYINVMETQGSGSRQKTFLSNLVLLFVWLDCETPLLARIGRRRLDTSWMSVCWEVCGKLERFGVLNTHFSHYVLKDQRPRSIKLLYNFLSV